VRRSDIARENRSLLERQHHFRGAADGVTEAWMKFSDVRAIAIDLPAAGDDSAAAL